MIFSQSIRLLSAFARHPEAALQLPVLDGLRALGHSASDSLRLDPAPIAAAVQAALPADIRLIGVAPDDAEAHAASARVPSLSERAAQSLRIYFAQLASPAGLFLDLAPERISQIAGGQWLWQPGAGLLQLPEALRSGMQAMYAALYAERTINADQFDRALVDLGFYAAAANDADRRRNAAVADAFREHIGGAADGERMAIRLGEFQRRYPGVYILCLYLALDACVQYVGFDVGAAYRSVFRNLRC